MKRNVCKEPSIAGREGKRGLALGKPSRETPVKGKLGCYFPERGTSLGGKSIGGRRGVFEGGTVYIKG